MVDVASCCDPWGALPVDQESEQFIWADLCVWWKRVPFFVLIVENSTIDDGPDASVLTNDDVLGPSSLFRDILHFVAVEMMVTIVTEHPDFAVSVYLEVFDCVAGSTDLEDLSLVNPPELVDVAAGFQRAVRREVGVIAIGRWPWMLGALLSCRVCPRVVVVRVWKDWWGRMASWSGG